MLTRTGLGEDAAATGDLDLIVPNFGGRYLTVKTKKGGRGTKPAVIDGNDIDRIFDVQLPPSARHASAAGAGAIQSGGSWSPNPEHLTLARVVLRDGHARSGDGDDGDGGAIRGGTVEFDNSRLVSNVADGDGGAIFNGVQVRISKTLLKGNTAAGDGGALDFPAPGDDIFLLVITRSRATHNSAGGDGGAVSQPHVSATYTRTHLDGNRASGAGGAISTAGASGCCTGVGITNSTVVGNRSGADGGGIDGGAGIIDSTVAGNQSGANGGGIAFSGNELGSISNSTISGNRAAFSGGGIHTLAGTPPVGDPRPGLRVGNSTIANNRAGGDGGGIGAFGGDSTTELIAVTVARNLADADSVGGGLGGGLYQGAGDVISVQNTIVALNALGAGATGPDCFNASTGFDSLGHNLIGNVDGCTGFVAPGDLIGGPLRLGKLADNGGPTKTIALKRGSRAIDRRGPRCSPRVVIGDQRDVKRDKKPDIGAYERGAEAPTGVTKGRDVPG